MTAHYLVDLFGNPLFPLNVPIIDVREPDAGSSLTNGCMIVRVPDFVQVVEPTDLQDLLTQKYSGLLAFYAGFANIAYDDYIDAAGIDLGYASTRVRMGQRGTVVLPAGGVLQTPVDSLLPSPAPTQAIITWEVGTYANTDPATDLLQRLYTEAVSSLLTCLVSFNNGATWNAVVDGGVFNVPLLDQGTDMILRFTNAGTDDLWLHSWAVIY